MAKTESITGLDGAPEIEMNRMPFGRWFREIGWRHVIGVLAILFAAFPVLYVISASFNPLGTVASTRLIPTRISHRRERPLRDGELDHDVGGQRRQALALLDHALGGLGRGLGRDGQEIGRAHV